MSSFITGIPSTNGQQGRRPLLAEPANVLVRAPEAGCDAPAPHGYTCTECTHLLRFAFAVRVDPSLMAAPLRRLGGGGARAVGYGTSGLILTRPGRPDRLGPARTG
ncbi:hypothetical protein Shyhy01_61010 [Streptomyces hygroscopicus subsp. hygroscopicus]|nr:hypothetical protein Shyhy01_61010 [Streptomyces hygroscopicus subsp. hygroscopicus]